MGKETGELDIGWRKFEGGALSLPTVLIGFAEWVSGARGLKCVISPSSENRNFILSRGFLFYTTSPNLK